MSAPFHCSLMSKATMVMTKELQKINFNGELNISDYSFNKVVDVPELYGSSGITINNNISLL